ncbi:MAG: DinB family protein, partial [Anaerolineales bacterium]|nr:DinB family protein [Anaerolineales bacterium]
MTDQTDTSTILTQYADGPSLLDSALSGLRETDLDLAPSADSWSIRQIVHHIVDGDDIWKTCIKTALGNSEALFSL